MARTMSRPASPPVPGDAGAEVTDEPVQVISRAAAIDVAKGSGMVCMRLPHESRAGRRTQTAWEVTATFAAVVALMDHLVCQGVERLVLESTSDYWRIWYYLAEAAGLEVWLVNARDVKHLPGRSKTDPLTELPNVSAAQMGCMPWQPTSGISERSESPGRRGPIVSPLAAETGHTRLNRLPAFSLPPIFDVSRSGPQALLQCL